MTVRPAHPFRFLPILVRDTRGAVAVMAAVGMTAMMGFLALGTETGLWYATKRGMQTAADAAAIAGAFELGAQAGRSAITDAATLGATQNRFQPVAGGASVTVNWPPASGRYTGNTQMVEVVLAQPTKALLSSLFVQSVQIRARAVAKSGGAGDSCILALDTVDNDAANFTGSTDIRLNGCGITANSVAPKAISISGSADVTTAFLQTAGGYDVSGSGTLSAGAIYTHAAAAADPYAGLSDPAAGSCAGVPSGKDFTLSPGTYCGGLTLQGQVSLNPGVYIIKGGTLKITAQAEVTGTGVTFVLLQNAKADITGGSAITITAPTSGSWAGVAFYSSRTNETQVNKFNGNSVTSITGAIYMASQEVDFAGGNATAGSGCTRIISKLVKFIGNSSLGNSCAGTGVAYGAVIRPTLVE